MASTLTLVSDRSSASVPRSWLERLWSSVADRGRPYASVLQPKTGATPLQRAQDLAAALLSERGEASGAAIARELDRCLRELQAEDRVAFYRFLVASFLPVEARLRTAAEAYLADPTPQRATELGEAAEPARQELLRRMNMAPRGTATLVTMRQDLLTHLRAEPGLKPLDYDMRHLLGSWFNRGFLDLRRIDWQTPAATLEKLITYEAVHEIGGWDDLRRRLAPDRRCFAFFHPALPGEPLIFVEVALTQGLAASVQPLLAPDSDDAAGRAREKAADTAIFYSISNCQEGLRGISFGNFLIKQVVEELKAELPGLVRFATLSPVPGFHKWLQRQLDTENATTNAATLLTADEAATLRAAHPAADPVNHPLAEALAVEQWWQQPPLAEALSRPLSRLCAAYLAPVSPAQPRGPSDPVARFHLGNGARLERINWLGNTAPRGIAESYGLMVNYLYDPEQIEANHEAFVHGRVVCSPAVTKLLATAEAPRAKAAKKA